jgi:lipopolysaccharide export system protein LptA
VQKIHVSSKHDLFSTIHRTFMTSLLFFSRERLTGLVIFCLLSIGLSAQQRTKIELQGAEHSRVDIKTSITYLRKPIFRQDNAILTCDSAVFYTSRNYFEAYENVHINQADTINIYSDRLTYDGNSKLAHLTSNVRMIDKTSTLTTNVLDYNMLTKIGTYVTGGKIVNRDGIVITSKNGYYFADKRDAYFRYNVVVVNDQSTIKSDTLRYNTFTNWAYFYGPTNIKEKDGGNLYTENGAYNTKTTYAYFGKNNLYTSGSRSMKGDSLYYDGIAGYGKAVRNITFRDTVDKMLMRGQLGYYYKSDQRTLVTRNAYAGMGTNDSIMVNNVKRPDTIWLGADTLETQMALQKTLKLITGPVIKKDNELGEEVRETSLNNKAESPGDGTKRPAGAQPAGAKKAPGIPVDQKDGAPAGDKKTDIKNKPKGAAKAAIPPAKGDLATDSLGKNKISSGKDSLVTDRLRKGDIPIGKADSVLKLPSVKKTDSLVKATALKLKKDSVLPTGTKSTTAAKSTVKPGAKKTQLIDSVPFNALDTVRTRIIKAYHHVNVFKSDMQAKSDSLFYTSADSTLRWYRNPMIWAQGSQQTGDTIYLQLRNKKVNSVQVIRNAFAVNVDTDSAKFNQIKGKLITGFFKDGSLDRMYVDGNAESVYFTKTEDGKTYDKMNQTVSSRIKITFNKNEIYKVVPIKDVEGATTPVADLKSDVLLTGFIWKPELRPRSKRDITNPKALASVKKAPAKKQLNAPVKPAAKNPASAITAGAKKLLNALPTKITPGSLMKTADSLQKKIPAAIDSARKVMPGAVKKADSLIKQPVMIKN